MPFARDKVEVFHSSRLKCGRAIGMGKLIFSLTAHPAQNCVCVWYGNVIICKFYRLKWLEALVFGATLSANIHLITIFKVNEFRLNEGEHEKLIWKLAKNAAKNERKIKRKIMLILMR